MQQIVIRHLSGQRANEADSFPADLPEDLIAGRDPMAAIHFGSQSDDLVSRQHLKITKDAGNPAGFRLVDLQSRNGTYVNRRRVYGSTFLSHNDRVQLGASGPEFRFELDPPPNGYVDSNPYTATMEMGLTPPQTREVFPSLGSTQELSMGGPRTIGRATVERMLDDTFGLLKEESNKVFTVGLVCLAAVLLVGLGAWVYIRRSAEEQRVAQQQSQEQIQKTLHQTQSEISAASEQVRNDVSHLTNQMSQSEQKTQASINSLSQKVSAIKRAQELEAKQRLQAANGQPRVAASGANAALTFGESLDRVNALVQQNKYADALEVSRQMMRLDPERYEGYFYGGVSALETQQMDLARTYLKQAEAKAPAEKRSLIEPLLATAQQISAKEK
jgi:hypothetical protein